MRRFAHLFQELDQSNRTTEKLRALVRYFREAPPADAIWGAAFLTGRRFRRAVTSTKLRRWAAEEAGLPLWLVEESHAAVGDLSEAIALLLPPSPASGLLPLHRMVAERIAPLPSLDENDQRELVTSTWRELSAAERLVWNKIILGAFRVGVADRLVIRALAEVAGLSDAVIAHRLAGAWEPTAETFSRLINPEHDARTFDPIRPYPFALAHPLQEPPESLGDPSEWLAEWKWDGLRAQLIRRGDATALWSRGEELIGGQFPEILDSARAAHASFVMDGEIIAWDRGQPLPFASLQHRIGRTFDQPMLFMEVPVLFMAFDLLEWSDEDRRALPLRTRRERLEELIAALALPLLRLSPLIPIDSWDGAREAKDRARAHHAEGIMLKRLDSPYQLGRMRGQWWKWKVDPYTIDAVLMYAQLGSGKRASLFTDYTFGLWRVDEAGGQRELVPFAKAYSGLTDDEIAEVDRFVRRHTIGRHGPVRAVEPKLVFELGFERIQPSQRHRSGVAVRFPRILRWRSDKQPADADTLATLKAMIAKR
jgi:DNA ligase-1